MLPKDHATAPAELRGAVQRVMSADCGVVRDAEGLQVRGRARCADLRAARRRSAGAGRSRSYEVINLLRVSRAIVASATFAYGVSRARTRAATIPDLDDALLGRLVVFRARDAGVRRRCPRVAVGGHQ